MSVTFSKLGSWGRLGNQCFQIASLIGLGKKYGHEVAINRWNYAQYFKFGVEQTGKYIPVDVHLDEKDYSYNQKQWVGLEDKTKKFNITGWLQSEKYWEENKEEVLKNFEFIDSFKEVVLPKYEECFSKPVIAISCRRGDYVGNPNYVLLPATYYIHALIEHFPTYRKDYNILILSDDIEWCRVHFQCLKNVYFATGQSDIEQLYLMSQCSHFIIANSTFSWWGAYLGEWNNERNGIRTKIIRPHKYFAGPLAQTHSDRTLWPERWISFNHEGRKINLKDVTFTIPVAYDSSDREQNLMLSLHMIQRDFDTNIIIGEEGTYFMRKINCQYIQFKERTFHRTKMLNKMAVAAKTPIIVNYDADVILPPMQLLEAVNEIREGADMVYPYDGRFARVPRQEWFKKIEQSLDIGIVGNTAFKGTWQNSAPSVGGCVLFDKQSFIYGGMENEKMIHYAPEDVERYERFGRLGFKVVRVPGIIYHIDHKVVTGTSSDNPHFKDNVRELNKQRNMEYPELKDYVSSWEWPKIYDENYYDSIYEGSIRSSNIILDKIQDLLPKEGKVLDLGAGIGQWGKAIMDRGYEYTAVDYKAPKHLLLIPEDKYIECDLRREDREEKVRGKYDLVCCLEVLEHIDERYAADIIRFITNKAPLILFSSAIKYQGGENHINEQFQSYWAKLFRDNGYYPINIRDRIINEDVEPWYINNLVLYTNQETNEKVEDFVLPKLYTNILSTLKGNKHG